MGRNSNNSYAKSPQYNRNRSQSKTSNPFKTVRLDRYGNEIIARSVRREKKIKSLHKLTFVD